MTDAITTIELDAVEPTTCQYRNCGDDATRMFAIEGDFGDGPAIAGYCHVHQLQFARPSEHHSYIGTPKRSADFKEVDATDD